MTIKQINDASSSDDVVKIDERDVNQVCNVAFAYVTCFECGHRKVVIVGTVLSMENQALANNYTIDDGTGQIEVRWWTDADSGDMHADKRSLIRSVVYLFFLFEGSDPPPHVVK